MLQVLNLVLPLFGLILLGYLSARWRKIPLAGLAWLNFFIVYISLPALFFRILSRTPLHEFANSQFLIGTTSVTLFVFIISFIFAHVLMRGGTRIATIQGFAGAYGNIGYMGPPLAIAALGPEAGVPVALIFCVDNSMHFTLAPLLMALGDQQKRRLLSLLAEIVKKILTHPFILATIAGVTAAGFEYQPPQPVDQLLLMLSTAAAPCALFTMGVTAALRPLKKIPAELVFLVPVKLLFHPFFMFLAISAIPNVNPVWLYSAILLAALPSATNVFVIAQQYKVWEERASSAVVISTVFSLVSVTAIIYLMKQGLI